MSCIFCKIVAGELPSSCVYEDDTVFAFLDIAPVQPGHVLLIPKTHVEKFCDADDETLAYISKVAKKIANAVVTATKADGCTVSTNNGAAAGQEVFHFHWHIIPRFTGDNLNQWPHGSYKAGEKEIIASEIKELL
ncbi:MAG: HIT family protein [bacterium]|nr:HIT family protein [bacterium]